MKKILTTALLAASIFTTGLSVPALAAMPSANSKLQSRIASYKKANKITLKSDDKVKLKGVCKPAQNKVKGLETRSLATGKARSESYNKITTRLDDLLEKLKAGKVDTEQFESDLAELKTKIATYKTNQEAFKVALADTRELDCQVDPEGFKSALESARTARMQVVDSAKDIRSYINETVKPGLDALKTLLSEKPTADNKENQ